MRPAVSDRFERAVSESLRRRAGELPSLVAELVREQSTLGNEEGAQQVIADRLARAGFEVVRVEPDAEAARDDPDAGYPSIAYDGRSSVVGVRRGAAGGRSLHLTGHVDVVPVDPDAPWSHEPWAGEVADGRVWGRGAGRHEGWARGLPARSRGSRRGLSRPTRRSRLQLRDRGGVRRQRHVVRASSRLHAPTRRSSASRPASTSFTPAPASSGHG